MLSSERLEEIKKQHAEDSFRAAISRCASEIIDDLLDEVERLRKENRQGMKHNEECQRLIAMYQGEGHDNIPEEREWKKLALLPEKKRTLQQNARLYYLARRIFRELDTDTLRRRLAAAEAVCEKAIQHDLEPIGSIRRRFYCEMNSLLGKWRDLRKADDAP